MATAKKKQAADPNEQVYIKHSSIAVLGRTTRRALESVWAAKGWKEASQSDIDAMPSFEVPAPAGETGSTEAS
jgi:hypothetical protein